MLAETIKRHLFYESFKKDKIQQIELAPIIENLLDC